MDYRQTNQEAKKRFDQLAAKRAEIDREMQALLQILHGTEIITQPVESENLADTKEVDSVGFTDKVRLVLLRSNMPLTPTEVRDGLEIMNIEEAQQKNVLIHVHNVLRRLLENGEIGQIPRDGKMAYKMLNQWERLASTLKSPTGKLSNMK